MRNILITFLVQILYYNTTANYLYMVIQDHAALLFLCRLRGSSTGEAAGTCSFI